MKGKNPTRKQKIIIRNNRLNPDNWLVVKVLPKEIHMQHKRTKTSKIIEI